MELRIETIKQEQFRKLSETEASQGIIAAFKYDLKNNLDGLGQNLIIALENISDPGNLGTIIRNCDWFGIKEVILGENCVELYNPKVIRSTMGSVFHLNFFDSRNLISDLVFLKRKGYKIVCTDMDGESIFNFNLPAKSILLFSSEATGPSRELLDITDSKITIPKFGQAESLNVASASAVTLSELLKTK
jgi:TrmH family RNA methyltransferase